MKYKNYNFFLIFLLFLCLNSKVYALKENDQIASISLYWEPKLEYAFNKTFSSSHEFAACQVFQKLGYNLAEISQIKRITPFPSSLKIHCHGISEEFVKIEDKDYSLASDSKSLKIVKFETLDVICNKVHYYDMIVENVTFSFPNSTLELDYLEKGRLKFYDANEIKLNVKVSEHDMLEVLKLYPKSKLLSNVKIRLDNNYCNSNGRVKLGLIVADFKLKGHIKQISSKKVNFVSDRLKLNGISQPRAFVNSVLNYINPVFDSSKLWLNLNIIDMKIIKGFVETNATINKKGYNNAN